MFQIKIIGFILLVSQAFGVKNYLSDVGFQPVDYPTFRMLNNGQFKPTTDPTAAPTTSPTFLLPPTSQPTSQPTRRPTTQPTSQPTRQPTSQPTRRPTTQPTSQPTLHPTSQPTRRPTTQPTSQPTSFPTSQPTRRPTTKPSSLPTSQPSRQPTSSPTGLPTQQPSSHPSSRPSSFPSSTPTSKPSSSPSSTPTSKPSSSPSSSPTSKPSSSPSSTPTSKPSSSPSSTPTSKPTSSPTSQPTNPTSCPSSTPTSQPSLSQDPTALPTPSPSFRPTTSPTVKPTRIPTSKPSVKPSSKPSHFPSYDPTSDPTPHPTRTPSSKPSVVPTVLPSALPTFLPTFIPSTLKPTTHSPTDLPTPEPTSSSKPTVTPSLRPSSSPSNDPTFQPTISTSSPSTMLPTLIPTIVPGSPTFDPSYSPSASPTQSLAGLWNAKYQSVNSQIQLSTSRMIFNELYSVTSAVSKPSLQLGSCSTWQSFTSGTLQDKSYLNDISSISMYVVSDLNLPAQMYNCSSKIEATSILSSLITPGSGSSVTCGSDVWTTNTCGSSSGTPSVCVNCEQICSSTCDYRNINNLSPCQLSESGSVNSNVCSSSYSNVNPDLLSSTQASGVIRILVADFHPKAPAPSFTSQTSTVTPTSVTLSLQLSGNEGSVACSAVPAGGSVPSTPNQIVLSNNIARIQSDSSASVTISSLNPVTDYSVYCTSQNSAGLYLPMSSTLTVPVQTSGQRSVSVSSRASSVSQGGSFQNAVTVSLSAVPSSDLEVEVSLVDGSNHVTYLSPRRLVFSATTRNLIGTASLTSENTAMSGPSTLMVTMVSGPTSAYAVSFSSGQGVQIVSNGAAMPAPMLSSAVFSSTGASLTLTFSSPTNKVTQSTWFGCASLGFSFSGVSSAMCQWTSSSTVQVTLGSQASLVVGNIVTVAQGVYKAACVGSNTCDSYPSNAEISVAVSAPVSSLTPVVRVAAPSAVTSCGFLLLDLSASQGSGGRKWSSIHFQVSGPDSTVSSALESYLNTLPNGFVVSPPSPIPGSLFGTSQGVYTFTVTLTNFLGALSYGSVNVVFNQDLTPVSQILGSSLISTTSSQGLSLSADGYLAGCNNGQASVIRTGLTMGWNIFENGVQSTSIVSSSKIPSSYKLAAFVLTPGKQYKVQYSVLSPSNGKSSFSSVDVLVSRGKLVAQIDGGSSQSVKLGNSLTLSGVHSYDEDYPSQGSSGLQFSWVCSQTSPTLSSTCPFTQLSALSSASTFTLQVPASPSMLSVVATVQLVVFDATRSVQASVSVVPIPAEAPVLSFTSFPKSKFNPDQPLVLKAQIQSSLPGSCLWSVDSGVNLAGRNLTVLAPWFSSSMGLNLKLVPNALPVAQLLTFTLSCNSASMMVAGQVTVLTNGPPLPGSFSADPASGTELTTSFSLSANDWVDEDLPLTYVFAFVTTSGAVQSLNYASEQSYISVYLPSGSAASGNEVSTVVQILDSLQAMSQMQSSVTVLPLSSSDLQSAINSLVSDVISIPAYSLATVNMIQQMTTSATTALNKVQCDSAPSETFCASLNREACSVVDNTCGYCLPGFFGDSRGANTQCYSESSRRRLQTLPLQTCPGSDGTTTCSNHGSCSFVNLLSGSSLDLCYIGDESCKAFCSCDSSYGGSGCSYTESDLVSISSTRQQLLGLLSKTVSVGEDEASMNTWLSSLSSIVTSKSDEISLSATQNTTDILQSIFETAISNSIDSPFLDQSLSILDSVLDVTTRSFLSDPAQSVPFSLTDTYFGLLKSYGYLSLQNAVLGQSSSNFIGSYFRGQFTIDGSPTVSGTMPQLPSEQSAGLLSNSFSISPSSTSDGLKYSLISLTAPFFRPSSYDSSSFVQPGVVGSNPLILQLSGDNDCSSGDGCVVTFKLTDFFLPVDVPVDTSFTTSCDNTNSHQVFSYTCPDNSVMSVSCNGALGDMVSICPRNDSYPVCEEVLGSNGYSIVLDDMATSTSNIHCHTTEFTSDSVSCSCHYLPLTHNRRLSSPLGVSSFQIAMTTTDPVLLPAVQVMPPTADPTSEPTLTPTALPTEIPTASPSIPPSFAPSRLPTFIPSARPSLTPTRSPTLHPTEAFDTSSARSGYYSDGYITLWVFLIAVVILSIASWIYCYSSQMFRFSSNSSSSSTTTTST